MFLHRRSQTFNWRWDTLESDVVMLIPWTTGWYLKRLAHADPLIRVEAVQALRGKQDGFDRLLYDRIAEPLSEATSDIDVRVRSVATETLTHLRWVELFLAAQANDSEKVGQLLDQGVDVNSRRPNGASALMEAIARVNGETIKLLIDRGADIDARDRKGLTPLLLAVIFTNSDIVSLLLDHGADIEAKDNKLGMTPLLAALSADEPCQDIIELLIARGANPNARLKRDWGTALVLSCTSIA